MEGGWTMDHTNWSRSWDMRMTIESPEAEVLVLCSISRYCSVVDVVQSRCDRNDADIGLLHCYMISAKIRQPKDPLWLCALDNLMECEVIIIFVRAWSYLPSLCHFIWAILSSTLCHLVIVRTIAMWGVDRWTGGQLGHSQSAQMMKTGLFSLHPRPSGLEKLIHVHNIVMCESSLCAALCCYCQEPRAAKPVDI